MMITFSVSDVRTYKGAALSCLVLLALSPLPVTQEWLERSSGYTDKPISQALSYLAELGRIVHTRSGWHLTDSSVQMALGMVDVLTESYPQPVDNLVSNELIMSRNYSESRNNSDSNPITIIRPLIKDTQDFELQELNTNSSVSRNYSDSHSEIWTALARLGCFKNDRTRVMVEMPHVTLEYIKSLAAQLNEQGKGGVKHAGMFVKYCEQNTPVEAVLDTSRGQSVIDEVEKFTRRR